MAACADHRQSPVRPGSIRVTGRVGADRVRHEGGQPFCLRRVEASAPIIVELREWTRIREELKRERVRLTNRMRE